LTLTTDRCAIYGQRQSIELDSSELIDSFTLFPAQAPAFLLPMPVQTAFLAESSKNQSWICLQGVIGCPLCSVNSSNSILGPSSVGEDPRGVATSGDGVSGFYLIARSKLNDSSTSLFAVPNLRYVALHCSLIGASSRYTCRSRQ